MAKKARFESISTLYRRKPLMPILQFTARPWPWHPNKVRDLEKHLSQLFQPAGDISEKRCCAIVKNIAYTLQYLQFLAQIEADLRLPEVLTKMSYKAFVLHGCSVVEAFFYYVSASSGGDAAANPKTKFQTLCNRVIKEKLIELADDFHINWPRLLKLRNRIHLQFHEIQDIADADYWTFNRGDYELMKSILKCLLTCNRFPRTNGRVDLRFLD